MPVVRDVSITVHTKNGPLAEYGTKSIGSGSIISSFIQSEDNTPFWINFTPSNPFDFKAAPDIKRQRYTANTKLPMWGNVPSCWDFSAHIFIDDNPKSEKNLIVDLPRNGKGIDNTVLARGRSCVDQDGVSWEKEWMFKEVGIENYFMKLTTDDKNDGEDGEDGEDEWEMVSNESGDNTTRKAPSMGQIKIQLFRVRQRGMDKTRRLDKNSDVPQHQPQVNPDMDISHTVGLGKKKPRVFHFVTVDYIDSPRDPWATIIFMYRGKAQLQKMGFTVGKDQARGNSSGRFVPGLPRSLSGSLYGLAIDDDGRFDDPESPTKKRSASRPACIFFGDEKPPIKVRKGETEGPDTEFKSMINLKRKSSRPADLATSLSAMSLDKNDRCFPRRLPDLKKKIKVKNEMEDEGLL